MLISSDTDGRSRYATCTLAFLHVVAISCGMCVPWDRVRLPLIVLFLRKYLQYVVVSSKKILFYNDEQDKEQSNPSMVLDIE